MTGKEENTAEFYYEQGIEKYEKEDYKGAIESYDMAIEKGGKWSGLYYNRGLAKHDNKDFEGAIKDYNEAIYWDYFKIDRFYNVELAKKKLDSFKGDAMSLKGNSIDENYVNAYLNRAFKLGDGNHLEKAIQDLDTIIEIDSNHAEAYFYRGYYKLKIHDYKGSIVDLSSAIDKDYALDYSYHSRGNAKKGLKDYKGAINDFSKVIEIDPNDKDAYSDRGFTKVELKDYHGAIEDYDKAIEIDQDFEKAYSRRAKAKALNGDFQGAIDDYTKAIEIYQDYAFYYLSRAKAKKELKDYFGAIKDCNKAIDLDFEDEDFYALRSELKKLTDDIKGAELDKAFSELYTVSDEDRVDFMKKKLNDTLIANAKMNEKQYDALSKDDNVLISSAVALNPYISEELLKNLLDHNDIRVKLSVIKNITCSEEILKKAATDKANYSSSRLRKEVARKSNTPAEIIQNLINDEYRWVREAAASHPTIGKEEIAKLINVGDRYILKGLISNSNCTKEEKDKINKLLVDENKYPKQYSKYKLMNDYTDVLDFVGGEVSIDDVIEALSMEESWEEYNEFNNYYDYNDLWQETGHIDLVDKVLLPDGSYEDIVVKDPDKELQRNDDPKNGENNLGAKQFFCAGKGWSSGAWTSDEFELEDEFNSDYVLASIEHGPTISHYTYANDVMDNKSDALLDIDITGELSDSFSHSELTLYANTKEGIKLVDDLNTLLEEMKKQGLNHEVENVVRNFLVKKYNLIDIK